MPSVEDGDEEYAWAIRGMIERVERLDEEQERERMLAIQDLWDRIADIEEEGPQVNEYSADEFESALLEAMTTPVDTRMQNWLATLGVPGSMIPSPIYGAVWAEMSEGEKDRYLTTEPETAD